MKNYHAGSFDQRITLTLPPTITRHAVTKEQISTPGATSVIWACREEAVMSDVKEEEIDATISAKRYVYFIIRWRPNIGPLCKVSDVYNNNFNVEAVEMIGRRTYLKLRCELITQGN